MGNQNNKSMQELWSDSYLSESSYLSQVYESYLEDPQSVSAQWQQFFEKNSASDAVSYEDIEDSFKEMMQHPMAGVGISENDKHAQVLQYIDAYRRWGHMHAKIDPLGLHEIKPLNVLDFKYRGLSESDLDATFNVGTFANLGEATLKEIDETLNKIYCHHIGFEYMHIDNIEEVDWLRDQIESHAVEIKFSKEKKLQILQYLAAAEGLEKFLALKYVAQKRFGLDGGEGFIPLLHEVIEQCVKDDCKEAVIGMAHRGRLNVLVNLLGKPPSELFDEFAGVVHDEGYTNDVKYHKGYSSNLVYGDDAIHVALAFNPSHLEFANPVVEGSVRARQTRYKDTERAQVAAILVHGDAAMCGQGVVSETINFSQTPAYCTGGSIHIVINNQIGFTTSSSDDRSTHYCTDIAKMVQAPVFHVNGDDPEAAVFAAELACAYRKKFKKDVFLDLVCYRRMGHNEADEPSGTQPKMYDLIRKHPSAYKVYSDKLVQENIITQPQAKQLMDTYQAALGKGDVPPEVVKVNGNSTGFVDWKPFIGTNWYDSVDTTIKLEAITALKDKLTQLPPDFSLQKQVGKVMDARAKMLSGEQDFDWGMGETLAYASLLQNGNHIRLVGQDSQRGTFSHRHSVLHDMKTGETYTPLQNVAKEPSQLEIYNSVLSECAALGFEYGYASTEPSNLVIWEAQYGDFANGAQVIFDQFITSAEQKWRRLCGLTVFLPHGYEGAGPEHSSARLERYLQACAQNNIQVCVPTTPAQMFHLLRRQVLRPYRKPLIVMTPKSLLRHKLAVSNLKDFTDGHFHCVIPEVDDLPVDKVKRVVMCAGKVYYDLLEKRREENITDIAIVRIEQFYTFPVDELTACLAVYKNAKELVWCQEEPENQGAWYSAYHRFIQCSADWQTLSLSSRPAMAAPAEGYAAAFKKNQQALVNKALNIEV